MSRLSTLVPLFNMWSTEALRGRGTSLCTSLSAADVEESGSEDSSSRTMIGVRVSTRCDWLASRIPRQTKVERRRRCITVSISSSYLTLETALKRILKDFRRKMHSKKAVNIDCFLNLTMLRWSSEISMASFWFLLWPWLPWWSCRLLSLLLR